MSTRRPHATNQSVSATNPRIRALRANALAGLIMLLLEYGLGISANLYSTLPSADRGKTLFTGLGAAVGNGPLLVTLHALLGTLLLLTGIAVVVRAWRVGVRAWVLLGGCALLATVVAWLSGTAFIARQRTGTSLAMALAAGAAILSYALIIYMLGLRVMPSPRTDR